MLFSVPAPPDDGNSAEHQYMSGSGVGAGHARVIGGTRNQVQLKIDGKRP